MKVPVFIDGSFFLHLELLWVREWRRAEWSALKPDRPEGSSNSGG
jgi:hypothetical protein